jgi:hypothetical protein
MPILSIDSSDIPEFETWRGELLKAAAQSVSPEGAVLNDDDVRRILERKMPAFYAAWGPLPEPVPEENTYQGATLSPDDVIRFFEGSDDTVIANFRCELEKHGLYPPSRPGK